MSPTTGRGPIYAVIAATAAAIMLPSPLLAEENAPTASSADMEARIKRLEGIVQEVRPGSLPAPSGDLEGRLRQLEAVVQQIQSSESHPNGAAAITAASETVPHSGGKAVGVGTVTPDGLNLQSADGSSRLHIGGLIQSDARFYSSKSGQTGTSTFYLRRVRPILDGMLYNKVDFRLVPDFGQGTTVLQDAYGEVRFSPSFKLRAGKYKPPISLERLQSAKDLEFVERSIANNLVPNRDIGVQVSGDVFGGRVNYAVGAFNGVADGQSSDGDAGDDKDIAARLFAQPFRNQVGSPLRGLGLGVGFSQGNRSESLSNLSFKTAGRATFFRFDPAVVGGGEERRIVPQFDYYHGRFGVLGEYVDSHQQVLKPATASTASAAGSPAVTGDLDFRGYVVQGSWVLTGEKASFQGVTPAHPFGMAANKEGAVELAARYSAIDVGKGVFQRGLADPAASVSSAYAYTIGLNWYLNKALKLQWNYEHTSLNRPIKLGPGKEDHEDALLARLQVAF